MASPNRQSRELPDLLAQLDTERAWLHEQIDKGRWAEQRLNLASLERELGQMLTRAAEKLEKYDA